MNYSFHNANLIIETDTYKLNLACPPDPSFLLCKKTSRLFGFIAGGDCTVTGKNDESSHSSEWTAEETADGTLRCCRKEESNIWNKKVFVLDAAENSLEWHHEIDGSGTLEEIRFFRSCYETYEYGFAGDFDEIYSVAPNFREKQWFHPTDRFMVTHGTDLNNEVGEHALASVPHVMGLHDRRDQGILSVGIFAQPGEYLWDEFVWNPEVIHPPTGYWGDNRMAGGFAIRYYGKKNICGPWISPRLVFTFPEHYEDTLKSALEYAYAKGYMPRPKPHKIYSWWKEPIYCTWDDQTALAMQDEQDYHKTKDPSAGTYCTQEMTDRWLNLLISHGAKPGIVILDDKWQKSKAGGDPDTSKWPNLRKWIDRCHENGIRVFLWGLAWHTEDIPVDEAILRDGKTVVGGDVTNPKYEARLREKIRRYFSSEPDCLNADGVKIDGLLALPVGRGLTNHKNIWGLELQKYFLSVFHDAAKKIRKDICLGLYTANPYLDEYMDMARLADMYSCRLSTVESMRWRRSVFAVTHPYTPVDTDSQWNYNVGPDYLSVLDTGCELGIPTTYNAEYLRRGHFFFKPDYHKLREEEYAKIAEVFGKYRKTLEKED